MAPRKVILDTDPGVDDILALLLACSALPEELELLLISVTYGNIDIQNCLRNVITLFHHVEREIGWRKSIGRDPGFATLRKQKPIVAIGPEHPLADQILMADFFHGKDGLGGIHESHPELTPADTWKALFHQAKQSDDAAFRVITEEMNSTEALFMPSQVPASEEILRLLRENEPDTITIVAIGPLTNLALAASIDPETFLRAKEIVVMGGTLNEVGNITPVAEFNTFADAIAAARVYALSSPNPNSTMPPNPPAPPGVQPTQAPPPFLAPYPSNLSRQLKVTLFPLDITHKHSLSRGEFRSLTAPLVELNSPLAHWVTAFMSSTFSKIESLQQNVSGDSVGLQLHDPLCIWYCMGAEGDNRQLQDRKQQQQQQQQQQERGGWTLIEDEDVRVETSGQWTRGMCVVDRRTRKKREDDGEGERPGDTGNWLGRQSGNRLRRCVGSPGEDLFGGFMLRRIFGLES